MPRPKLYSSAAQRQQAYRHRLKLRLAGVHTPAPKTSKKTRPQRLASLIANLDGLTLEYQHWLESMPDNLSESQLAFELEETIEALQDISEQLQDLNLPKGFGR